MKKKLPYIYIKEKGERSFLNRRVYTKIQSKSSTRQKESKSWNTAGAFSFFRICRPLAGNRAFLFIII